MKGLEILLNIIVRREKKILQDLGTRIHQGSKYENEWARLTSMGGFREVGRSCMLLQTPNSRVLLDCGVNVAGDEKKCISIP